MSADPELYFPRDAEGFTFHGSARLSNYYGAVILCRREGEWLLTLENHNGTNAVRVSGEFAAAWLKEFPLDTPPENG